jgi:4-hydroxyacetophenone monooxygenase
VVLGQHGVPYEVIERADTLGGVWRDNRYPGAGVDTPSHLYSYSFAPHDWQHFFADREEIAEYLAKVARDFDVLPNVRFGTEVERAKFDTATQRWVLTTRAPDGTVEVTAADVVFSAVGAFACPKMPNIPGLDTFTGPLFHTAHWPEGESVSGKRVAVIGNGASAMQVVPAIAGKVDTLTVFQRDPQWVQPFAKLHQEVPDQARFLLRDVPLYRAWYRLRLTWIFHDKLFSALQRDDDWPDQSRSINQENDRHRTFLTKYIEGELADRPDLIAQLVPTYPPFGKRMLMDNGWYTALQRDNAELVSEPIKRVVPTGVVTASGRQFEVDVIVAATGFDVVRFLSSVDVVGVDGKSLREEWDDDNCAAYLGLAVPGFPNFFMLYGPNTQPGHGGSLIGTVEDQLDYVVEVLRHMFKNGIGSVACRRSVYEEYVRRVDDAHDRMVWTHPGFSTYYRNSRGRVVVNSPFRNLDFWRMTRDPEVEKAFICEPDVDAVASERAG